MRAEIHDDPCSGRVYRRVIAARENLANNRQISGAGPHGHRAKTVTVDIGQPRSEESRIREPEHVGWPTSSVSVERDLMRICLKSNHAVRMLGRHAKKSNGQPFVV
jgi:hypothetical protein